MQIFIVGGGPQLPYLVHHFSNQGHDIVVINEDLEYCKIISRKYDIKIIHGDATNPEILDDAIISRADMVMVMKDKDSENFVICEMLRVIYKIKYILAVVHNPSNIDIFMKLGIENVISISEMIASFTEQKMNIQEITELYNIFASDDLLSVIEINMEDDYASIGYTIDELEIPSEAIISAIIRENSAIIPKPNTELMLGDRLLVSCIPSVKKDLIKVIKG